MGVRGLTTFIKEHKQQYLKNHKLHGCTVILDGNSVATILFIWNNSQSAFGGDYDKYAKYVKDFFKLLQKCQIKPLVVFDGGYEERKMSTVRKRMRDKITTTRYIHPQNGSRSFPLFMRTVFREVLVESGVPFAQSDFEADDEIAALARQLQCPVVSFDSDFYIYNVLYIPMPTILLEAVKLKNSGDEEDNYFLPCKIYKVDTFIESFGGMDKNMLPLLAALLGNDYIRRSVFKKFYEHLKIPKGRTNALQKRVTAILKWLRNETFQSALEKVLGRMKKGRRRLVTRQIKRIIQGYVQCSSVLGNYLSIPYEEAIMESELGQITGKITEKELLLEDDGILCEEKNDKEEYSSSSSEESELESSNEEIVDVEDFNITIKMDAAQNKDVNSHLGHDVCDNKTFLSIAENEEIEIPIWLLDNARKGHIHSSVIDILSLKQYFCFAQVEDHTLPHSHNISLPILNVIVGLLTNGSNQLVKYWTRNGFRLDWFTVDPVFETKSIQFPLLKDLPTLSITDRKIVLLETVGVDVKLEEMFPDEWQLFVLAILYWLKNMQQPVSSISHLHTMIMCIVGINVLDSNLGVHRVKQTFTRKYKNFLHKVVLSRSELHKKGEPCRKTVESCKDIGHEKATPSVKETFGCVSCQDCVLMFEPLLSFHHLSEDLKSKPKLFCLTTIHAFAQFQSCLHHLMVLNSILGFPVKECKVSHFYSGTFVYNMFTNLIKRRNINAYVETLFKNSPSLLALYQALVDCMVNSLSSGTLYQKNIKTRKRKKKAQERTMKNVKMEMVKDHSSDSEEFDDENNIFALLNKCNLESVTTS